jgi:hypothetical protein
MDEEELSAKITLREVQVLLSSRAWGTLVSMVQEQADGLQNQLLRSPVESIGDALKMERVKGELLGRLSLTDTVDSWVETLQYQINMDSKGQ